MATAKATTWVMVMATRLVGDKEGKGKGRAARVMATAKRVGGNKDKGNSDCGKSDGNGDKVGRQATTMATKKVIVMATRCGARLSASKNNAVNFILRLCLYHFLHMMSSLRLESIHNNTNNQQIPRPPW
jgi:hypothetical protein